MARTKHLLLMALKEPGFAFFLRNQGFSEKWEFQPVAEDRHNLIFKGNPNPTVSICPIFIH